MSISAEVFQHIALTRNLEKKAMTHVKAYDRLITSGDNMPMIRCIRKEEADWLLRVQRRNSIFAEMQKLGPFAAMTQVSLLIGLEDDFTVRNLIVSPLKEEVLYNSRLYQSISSKTRVLLRSLEKEQYDYIENAYRDFSAAFLLAEENVNTKEHLTAFWMLKQWCIRKAGNPDMVTGYLKYMLKVAQAVMLKTEMPEKLPEYPQEDIYDFIPTLKFIAEFRKYGKRDLRLHLHEAYILAQLSSFNRAGPYPTPEKASADTIETIEMLLLDKKIQKETLKCYLGGLMQVHNRLHEPDAFGAHISLSGSGSQEQSRSEGGKGTYLMDLVRDLCSQQIGPKELGAVVGLKDCLGQVAVHNDTARIWLTQMKLRPVTWAQVLYVPAARASLEVFTEGDLVPYGLARITILVCTNDLLKFGHYDREIFPNPMGMPLFLPDGDQPEFQPNVKAIPVRAGISIEAAGKSRLITSAPASFTEIGELINCFMRNWLSKDPFCRIGFEENDKLWEVLKTHKRNYEKKYLEMM